MESRIIELEVKLAFQDDLLDALNLAVTRQQKQIDLLQQQLRFLHQQIGNNAQGNEETPPLHEIPPHY